MQENICGRNISLPTAKAMGKMDEFSLYNLEDERLDTILAFSNTEQIRYFGQLIERYYPHIEIGTDEYYTLIVNYKSSFLLERIYRDREDIQSSFTAIYTRTGLIRELVNDLYHTDESLVIH